MKIDSYQYMTLEEQKILYFSLDEQQSKYHVFNGECSRYTYVKERYPIVYKLKTSRELKLVNVDISKNGHIIGGIAFPSNLFERKFMDYISLIYSDINFCEDTLNECNKTLVFIIQYLNKYFGTKIDGYYCETDQNEIGLSIKSIDSISNDNEFKVLDIVGTYETMGLELDLDNDDLYNSIIMNVEDICQSNPIDYENFKMVRNSDVDLIYKEYKPITNFNEQLYNEIVNI